MSHSSQPLSKRVRKRRARGGEENAELTNAGERQEKSKRVKLEGLGRDQAGRESPGSISVASPSGHYLVHYGNNTAVMKQ